MKLIKGFNHHYIDKNGRVLNTKTNNYLTPNVRKNGYYLVTINEFNKSYKRYLHRILGEAFIKNPLNKRTVNHIDGNKLNNNLDNLEWATDSENLKHAYRIGLISSKKLVLDTYIKEILERFFKHENLTNIVKDYNFNLSSLSIGIKNYLLKFPELSIKFKNELKYQKTIRQSKSKHNTIKIDMFDKHTKEFIKTFNSLQEATIFCGKKSSGSLSNALNNKQKYAYGYIWKFHN